MRFTLLLSVGVGLLAADSAVAGPCHPSVTVSSSSTAVESSSVAETTSSTVTESSFTSSTSVASVESSTEEPTSSIETTSSTSSIPVSNPTFTILAGDFELKDGAQNNGIYIFDSERTDISVHSASIDPDNGRMVFSSGLYWVAQYITVSSVPATLLSDNHGGGYGSNFPPLTCEVADDLKITCSAPAGECDEDDNCGPTSGTWDQFCYRYEDVFGKVLYIFSSCPSGWTPVTLYAQVV
ncbi:hypothetical protein AK830_g8592 [Neonectria ditissima]|uniref:Uncharacterized protein n=1 Tax=Neonectria ditissima TaxID=78410 RepID=A0A0P7BDW0_9HYPO|nr:hypothetical protein AK830_g8592 [Neonectria ditissima]